MLNFQSFDETLDYVRALAGYIPSLRPTADIVEEAYGGYTYKGRVWEYYQTTSAETHVLRRCLILTKREDATGADTFWLSLPEAVAKRVGTVCLDSGMRSTTLVSSNDWLRVLSYNVPVGKVLVPNFFQIYNSVGSVSGRVAEQLAFGSYTTVGSGTFTDGGVTDSGDPYDWYGEVYFDVTTQWTGGGNGAFTITVTYINQDGTTGRTGSFVATKGEPVGSRYLLTLQSGDIGVRDITAMTGDGSTSAGVASVYGVRTVASGTAVLAGTMVSSYPNSVGIKGGRVAVLEIVSATTGTSTSQVSAVFDVRTEASYGN